MAGSLSRVPRLYNAGKLSAGRQIELPARLAHYLCHVMRRVTDDEVRLFNGTDGEWLCIIAKAAKRKVTVVCSFCLMEPQTLPDIDFLFAPLKHARLDYLVQKATELGARRLRPVLTDNCIVSRVNLDRMRANVVEAAEQCDMVAVPEVLEPVKLTKLLSGWRPGRRLIFCDETLDGEGPFEALCAIDRGPIAVLVGPEGGFSDAECARLHDMPAVTAISLGPRIMRADTAGVAALTLVQAILGDWQSDDRAEET